MLEVCVDTLAGAEAAVRGGAGRIELCAALSEGGLTPSAGLMQAAARLPVPVFAMIRPRCGNFRFSEAEARIMLHDITTAAEAGIAGVVLGAQGGDGGLDLPLMKRLLTAAHGMGTTLHRVVDIVPDPLMATDQAAQLGFDRILTSGGRPTAPEGTAMIASMIARADGRLSVMPGSGLTPENLAEILIGTGATEVHASCRRQMNAQGPLPGFDPPGGVHKTDEDIVRRMVARLPAGVRARTGDTWAGGPPSRQTREHPGNS